MKESKYYHLLVIAQIFLYNNANDVNTVELKQVPQKAIDISYIKFCHLK
jgi:hypothetical protein